MTRQILGLTKDDYYYLCDSLTSRAIKSESIDTVNEIVDIELSDNVIMKVYDTDLILDLGARRIGLSFECFREIMIR